MIKKVSLLVLIFSLASCQLVFESFVSSSIDHEPIDTEILDTLPNFEKTE